MASQGPNNGSTFENNTGIGTVNWTNPGNAVDSNDTDAQVTLGGGGQSRYLAATDFGFSIPSGATIDGIKVEVEMAAGDAFFNDNSVKIVKGGSVAGNDLKRDSAVKWPTSDTYITYGGETELWGETWSDSDINSSGFGFVISTTRSVALGNAFVDHIRITVYYTESGGGSETISPFPSRKLT